MPDNTPSVTAQDNTYNSAYMPVNIVEDLITAKAPEFIKRMGICSCYRCVNDIIAMTLNILPPKYIVTQKGMLFARIASYENQYATDVVSALTKACVQVSESPRH